MTTNKQLRELAEGVKHWGSSVTDAWPSDPDFNDLWAAGAIDEDGNKYPVIEVDADQYDAPGDSERLARFFTAANPATVLALLDEIEALQAECERWKSSASGAHQQLTANRIETEKLAVDWSKAMAECEKLRKDAERYQWLRARWGSIAESYRGTDSDEVVAMELDPDGWDVDPEALLQLLMLLLRPARHD